jgi:hypothetical protein
MVSQIQVLNDQLHTKNEQIDKLNENMKKQAFQIQSLIQAHGHVIIYTPGVNSENICILKKVFSVRENTKFPSFLILSMPNHFSDTYQHL